MTGGPTLKQLGGPYRRMEVITMTVVAILIAAGVVALVYVGLFFVVMGFFFAIQGTGEVSIRKSRERRAGIGACDTLACGA